MIPKMLLIGLLVVIIPVSLILWMINVFTFVVSGDQDAWRPISPLRWILSFIIPFIIIKLALKRRSLDKSGASMAFVVGFVLTLSNFCFLAALFAFFVTASKVTKFRPHLKKKYYADHKEGGQRNWVQVLCNGGAATEIAIILMLESGCGEHTIDFVGHYTRSWLCMAVLGALACSSGDTWASEVGSVIGKGDPRLVTTLKKVPRGTNGAVSIVGLICSGFGGFLVGIAYYGVLLTLAQPETVETAPAQWPVVVVATLAGFIGSLVDSYLGAIVQYSGFHTRLKLVVEVPGPEVRDISGSSILDNHSVNLLASIIMTVITPVLAFHLWLHCTPANVCRVFGLDCR